MWSFNHFRHYEVMVLLIRLYWCRIFHTGSAIQSAFQMTDDLIISQIQQNDSKNENKTNRF